MYKKFLTKHDNFGITRMLLKSANCWASLLCTSNFAQPAVTGLRLQDPVPSQLSVLWPVRVWRSAELKMLHLFLRTLLAGRVVVAVAVCRKNPPHGRSKRSPHFFSSVYTCGELTIWAMSPCFDVSFERNTMECSCGKLLFRFHFMTTLINKLNKWNMWKITHSGINRLLDDVFLVVSSTMAEDGNWDMHAQ